MSKKLLLFVLAFTGAIGTQAQTMYVDADATGNNDGTSWANAFTNLDTAFFYHDIVTWGSEIWIAEGTYTPGDGVDRNASFTLSQASIYGGFDGTETTRSDRDPKTNLTILSGDLLGNDNGNVSWAEPTRSDNSYSVIYNQSGFILDGFIIEGGQANDNSGSDIKQAGAAIYNYNNGLDIVNCIFRNNVGYEDAVIRFRAAIGYNSNQDIYNCEFYNNQGFGSLIGATRPNNFTRTHQMNLFNNLFHNNELISNDGSIIYANSYENAGSFNSGSFVFYIYNNTFVNNTLGVDGGTIGFGTAFNNQPFNMNCNLTLEVIGNIFWDSNGSPLVRKSRLFSGNLVNSEWFIFGANLIKQSTPIVAADLYADVTYVAQNVYNQYPMFTDTANYDFSITACASPVNDIASYDISNAPISAALFTLDFYGNERLRGMAYDAGHCEVQNETVAIDITQVGSNLEATSGFTTYTWYYLGDPNNPIILTETTNTITPTNGDGAYTVIVEDADMCNNRADYDFCSSVTVSIALEGDSLVATGTGGTAFVWYLNGNSLGANNETYTPTQPGIYSVSHFFFDGQQVQGCSASASFEITCDNIPDAIITNNNGTLEVNADYDTYQWSQNGTNILAETNATFSPAQDGDYQVSVIGDFGCSQTSAIFSYCSSVSVSIVQNDSILEATTGFATYQWFLIGGSGTGISGATNASYSPSQDGSYYVTASDGNCLGTSNTVAFSLDTTINDTTIIGITAEAFAQLNVYPNPSSNFINIETGSEAITAIRILDVSGRLIKQYGAVDQISVGEIQTGIYWLEIRNKEKIEIIKFIKS